MHHNFSKWKRSHTHFESRKFFLRSFALQIFCNVTWNHGKLIDTSCPLTIFDIFLWDSDELFARVLLNLVEEVVIRFFTTDSKASLLTSGNDYSSDPWAIWIYADIESTGNYFRYEFVRRSRWYFFVRDQSILCLRNEMIRWWQFTNITSVIYVSLVKWTKQSAIMILSVFDDSIFSSCRCGYLDQFPDVISLQKLIWSVRYHIILFCWRISCGYFWYHVNRHRYLIHILEFRYAK